MPLDPPRDDNGVVIPHDDPAIAGDSCLIRKIHPQFHVVPDENIGGQRISSGAFSATNGDPTYGLSVDLGQLLAEKGLPYSATTPSGMGAVRMETAAVRGLELPVGSDPEPDNDCHGQVWGVKKSKRAKIHGLDLQWVVELPGVRIK